MSRFIEKIVARQNDNYNNPPVTVAFLGDSVTQGCFELYKKSETEIETVFDKNSAYHKYFAEIFSVLCPVVPVNIINAGINVTELLSNKANHPTREMNWLFAYSLVETIFGI